MIVMLDFQDKLPRSAHMFSMAIAHLNSSLNPLLYALTNPLFQKGYKVFIRKIFCIGESIDIQDIKSHTNTNQNVKTVQL